MSKSEMLHIRMDSELKARGNAALSAMGLTASEAVRLFYHRIVAEQAFPLELRVPNATTRAAMADADEIARDRGARFDDAGDLIGSLEN